MAALAVVSLTLTASPALAETAENGVRGVVTEVSRSALVVLVEENPSEESGSAKGEFAVTEETEVLKQRGGVQAPASFEDLRAGQTVEATYAGPVAESYPTRGIAGRIVILGEDQTDTPAVLPDTGGAPVLVALLVAGCLLARRVARFSR